MLLITPVSLCSAQNVTVKNGAISFPTIADYEYFADNPNNREAINTVAGQNSIPTLAATSSNDLLDGVVPEFLQQILNSDYIVSIDSFYVKIDFVNQRGLVIASAPRDAYNNLVTNNLTATGMMQFTMDDGNALEIMEGIENGNASVEHYKELIVKDAGVTENMLNVSSGPSADFMSTNFFSCGNPSGQDLKRWDTWGTPRPDGSCNAPGNNTALLAGDLKLVYQKAIIYFSLQSKEKCRQYCQFGGNPQTAGTVSVYMYLSGTAKYKRCGWNEKTDNYTSNFT